MRSGRRKIRKSKLAAAIFIIFAAAVMLALRSLEKRIDPKIKEVCTYCCRSKLTEIMTSSAMEAAANSVAFSKISSKEPERIDIDTESINKLQADIVKKINSDIDHFSSQEFDIPVGSLSDSYFFSGKGFNIKIKFVLNGSVTVKLKSEFRSAGINQTCHVITAILHADGIMLLPNGNTHITVEVTCPIHESIIVGDVPDGGIITKGIF